MKSYNFKNINRIFAVGGMHSSYKEIFDLLKGFLNVKPEDAEAIHPKELERRARKEKRNMGMDSISIEEARRNLSFALKKIKVPTSINNIVKGSLIVVLGDSGFGFAPEKKVIKFLTDKNKILQYNDINVVFIRGNNDDPSYFDGEKIDFSNIKAIPDYSLLETKDKNILCVGGAISADRTWKIEQETRIGKKTYWENEAPVFRPELIREILESGKHIDYVLSHSAPSFLNIEEDRKTILHDWEKKDKNLDKDMDEERICMDRIFEFLRDNGSRPAFWGFGHFTNSLMEKRANTVFDSLNTANINKTIEEEIGLLEIETIKAKMFNDLKAYKKPRKLDAGDNYIGRLNAPMNAPRFELNDEEIARMFDEANDHDENQQEEFEPVDIEIGEREEGEAENGVGALGGVEGEEIEVRDEAANDAPVGEGIYHVEQAAPQWGTRYINAVYPRMGDAVFTNVTIAADATNGILRGAGNNG